CAGRQLSPTPPACFYRRRRRKWICFRSVSTCPTLGCSRNTLRLPRLKAARPNQLFLFSLFFCFLIHEEYPVCVSGPCSMFRPRRTMVVAIAAEPVEKPDARLLGVRPRIVHATGKSIGFTELSDKSRNYVRARSAT